MLVHVEPPGSLHFRCPQEARSTRRRRITWCAAFIAAWACAPSRPRAEALTRDTLTPLLIADVNALQANRYFLRSMLDFNSTPFTIGYSTQQAGVEYARIDGATVPGGLSKDQLVLSIGWGRPATDFAFYTVLNFAGATASNFPKMPITNENTLHIRATNSAVFAAAGVAYEGWVLQFGWHYTQLRVHADQYGRLTHCGDNGYCLDDEYPTRPGAPSQVVLDTNKKTASSRMIMLESKYGYSASALISELDDVDADGSRHMATQLAALRLLAQPGQLREMLDAAVGFGLNTYAKQLDYYGDDAEEVEAASRAGLPPPVRDEGIVEIPIVAEQIYGTGLNARVVGQLMPSITPRLAEVGYVYTVDESLDFVPSAGARAKVFRRGDSMQAGADAYLGFFWVTTRSDRRDQGRGVSFFATYSYNSPDASNFIPLPNAHILGVQLVWGNPAALAPPVPSVRIPKSAQYEGGRS